MAPALLLDGAFDLRRGPALRPLVPANLTSVRSFSRWLASFYFQLAITGKLLERAGLLECECDRGCWCHRPVLSTFRWVFPFGHSAGPDCGVPDHA